MRVSPEKRKQLIDSLRRNYIASFNREFVWGKPNKEYLDSLAEDFVVCLIQADEWIELAKSNCWKSILAEAKNLKQKVEDSLQFADKGGDPFIHGQWIMHLLQHIPNEITKQKLGITSLKEMRKM